NVHQTGIDRWPGRSILPSGSRPASRAISRARSWYGSDRSMPCTWLLPPADASLRLLREAERELHCQKVWRLRQVSFGYEVEQLISAIRRAQPTGVTRVPVEDRLPSTLIPGVSVNGNLGRS